MEKNFVTFILLHFFVTMHSQIVIQPLKEGKIPVIDISKDYPKKELILQEIADIEYIRLDTTDDILLSGIGLSDVSVLTYVSDKYIVTYEMRFGDIFVFNRNGKIVSHFNHKGQGSREYPVVTGGVIFDEKNEEIYVCYSRGLQVYSLKGEYKRTLRINSYAPFKVYNFDDKTLLVFEEKVIDPGLEKKTVSNPYRLISKIDGSVAEVLDIHFPKRISNSTVEKLENNKWRPIIMYFPNSIYYGQDFMISDLSSDTIYKLTQNKEITPILVRIPSVHTSDEIKKVISISLTTDKFIYFGIIPLDFKSGRAPSFMYDFELGEIFQAKISNAEFAAERFSFGASPYIDRNMSADLMSVPPLINAYKNKQLKGTFKKFVSTLDEFDNPIVRIYKFK